MSFFWQNGFRFKRSAGSFAIDPSKLDKGTVLLSHAHSDHASGLHASSTVFSTPATLDLLHASGKKTPESFTLVEPGSHVQLDDVKVSFHSSAHILGSVQFLLDSPANRLLYSSDIVLDAPPFWPAPKIPSCDTLIIESTFGLPKYSFPKREAVFEKMAAWAKNCFSKNELVIFSGYSLGKSQELTWFCNEYLGIVPHVAKPIAAFNDVYQKHGVALGKYELLNHNLREAQVLILPPTWVTPPVRIALAADAKRRVNTAFCTGWDFRGNGFDQTFPLSDHADFNGLMEIVRQSGASRVLTMHGFEAEFASAVKQQLGIPAEPLKNIKNVLVPLPISSMV